MNFMFVRDGNQALGFEVHSIVVKQVPQWSGGARVLCRKSVGGVITSLNPPQLFQFHVFVVLH